MGFWWGDLKEINDLEDLDVDGDSIKMGFKELGWGGRGLDLSGFG